MESSTSTRSPRDRKRALLRAGQLQICFENRGKKEVAKMERIRQIEGKIQKLQSQQNKLQREMSEGQIKLEEYNKEIEALKLAYEFTETELLEAKLEILKRQQRKFTALLEEEQISNLQKTEHFK